MSKGIMIIGIISSVFSESLFFSLMINKVISSIVGFPIICVSGTFGLLFLYEFFKLNPQKSKEKTK